MQAVVQGEMRVAVDVNKERHENDLESAVTNREWMDAWARMLLLSTWRNHTNIKLPNQTGQTHPAVCTCTLFWRHPLIKALAMYLNAFLS